MAPAALALRLAEMGMPSRLPAAPRHRSLAHAGTGRIQRALAAAQTQLTDVYLFGEVGLFAARRAPDGAPAPILPGPHGAPRDVPGSSIAGETLITPQGTLGLRGPMVPVAAYAPPTPASELPPILPPRDYVDTGYAARLDGSTGAICITAPPSGIMAVGGYDFWRMICSNGPSGSARARC